jgi:hypothetical protein
MTTMVVTYARNKGIADGAWKSSDGKFTGPSWAHVHALIHQEALKNGYVDTIDTPSTPWSRMSVGSYVPSSLTGGLRNGTPMLLEGQMVITTNSSGGQPKTKTKTKPTPKPKPDDDNETNDDNETDDDDDNNPFSLFD